MASKNNSQVHQSGNNTSEDKVDQILETLPVLDKLHSTIKEKEENTAERCNQIGTLARNQSAPPALTHVAFESELVKKLQNHFRYLKWNLRKLDKFQTHLEVELDKHLGTLQSLITDLEDFRISYRIKPTLEGIERKISDLLYQLPLSSGKSENQKSIAYGDQDDEDEVHQYKAYYYLPKVEYLIKSAAFREVKQKFMELEIEQKICLLSFAVFPENREVHRTVLMYWWIGEGILCVEGAEEVVKDILKEFTQKELVEPVVERRKVEPSSYKMTPFVHSSVIHLSKEIGVFDICNKPSTSKSKMGKVCLVEASREATPAKMQPLDIETVFNVSERYLDRTVKWFLKNPRAYRRLAINSSEAWFKSLNVFYLGRWERSQKRHIHVQNHELMKCLKHMTKVRLLSFQGISNIRSLTSSVCKLHQLIILDLRECYDLRILPEKIDSLENLVYLDMTGCYFLEYIPLRLALLKKLEVLKGFVVSDAIYETVACKLDYLKNLPKLRKLSLEINRDDISVDKLGEYLVELEVLTSLKVTWRRDLEFFGGKSKKIHGSDVSRLYVRFSTFRHRGHNVRIQLKKLSLQRFTEEQLPRWLHPERLPCLKKLHIGGARKLKSFGREDSFSVEVLRLTSLPKLTVGWIELKKLYFPNLTFLEKYECPRVTLTPCDGNGIWRSDQD